MRSATPAMVTAVPLMVIEEPTIAGSPLKRRSQKWWLRTTSRWSRSDAARDERSLADSTPPMAGATRSVSK